MRNGQEWLSRKKQWLRAAIGRAVRRIAQSAACGILLSLDLAGEIRLWPVAHVSLLTGLACLLMSIAQYPNEGVEK